MASENSDPNLVGQQEGRVKHLIKAFESLKFLSDSQSMEIKGNSRKWDKRNFGKPSELGQENHESGHVRRWAIPGIDEPLSERQPNSLSVENYGDFDHCIKYADAASSDQSDTQSFLSVGQSECSSGSRRRCKKEVWSYDSSERGSPLWKNWTEHRKKQGRVTAAQPFKLRTEQRGHMKEQEFMKKIQQMIDEEEKHRIPIAQGLPWTTDEPQILPKPPVKEQTKPLDIKLRTESRAVERAQFDHTMEEKFSFLEQKRLEEERLQKLAEEEEIKRLRKEMVPHAQLMPYFDRPFVPKRSSKSPTVPKGPKFHNPHHTKCSS
eukprot:Gb_13279 [translate_table: standard]